MVTLYLLRHAKSSWDHADLDDHDRPLNKRGHRGADLVGAEMKKRGFRPDLVLCSTAVRAEETLGHVLEHVKLRNVLREGALYLASKARIIQRVAEVDDDVASVLLVGHEPGIGGAARALAGPDSDPEACALLRTKYPTGALAVLEFPEKPWGAVRPGAAILKLFIVPKSLE